MPARPAYPTGLSGRLGPRSTGTTTRAQGALLDYPGENVSSPDRQTRPEVCEARPHENTVVERRKARGPDSKGPRTSLASVSSLRGRKPLRLSALRSPLNEGEQRERTSQIPGAPRRGNEKPRPHDFTRLLAAGRSDKLSTPRAYA